MSSIFTRAFGIGFVALSASALVMSCASSDNGSTHFGTGGSSQDSGLDSSSGGVGNGGSPATGGNPGTGGMSNGGSSSGGASNGGSSSGGASNGGSGAGGAGTGGASGTCNPAFCPTSGFGTPCCVTPNGPCGVDTGTGCQQGSTGNDF